MSQLNLYARLTNDTTRPLLNDPDPLGKLQTLLKQRQPLYAQADLRITVSEEETPAQIATRVLKEIPDIPKHQVPSSQVLSQTVLLDCWGSQTPLNCTRHFLLARSCSWSTIANTEGAEATRVRVLSEAPTSNNLPVEPLLSNTVARR